MATKIRASNLHTEVNNSIVTKLPLAGGTMTGDIDMGNHSLLFGDFRIQREGNSLTFKHNNNVIALLNSLGDFEVVGDLNSNQNFIYTIGGFTPDLVIDFKQNYYRTGGTDSTLSSSVTHTRASSATMTNSSGNLVTVGNNVPRTGHHVYNGSAWVNEGILHESEARTNALHNSGDVTGTRWVQQIGVTSTATGSPFGSYQSASPTSTGSVEAQSYQIGNPLTQGATYVAWSLAKYSAGNGWFSVSLFDTSSQNNRGWFDLQNGVVGSKDTSIIDYGMIDYGDGWWLCWASKAAASTSGGINLGVTTGDGATGRNSGDVILIAGSQFEQGSTPSSYIPTTGSTATRAAETLTVPNANMPLATPVIIGTEEITNGTFNTDTSGWIAANSTLSVDSNRLKVTATGSFAGAKQDFTTVTGKTYIVTANFTYGDINGYLQIEDRNGGGYLYNDWSPGYSSDTSVTGTFTAVSNLTRVLMLQKYGGSGNYSFWDNISVKEINPISVSIQMDGKMTYSDNNVSNAPNGQGGEVQFSRWWKDASNFISQSLLTDYLDGTLYFIQKNSSGGVDFVQDHEHYDPGVNIPFNIASRHGSTFINGASAGTAFTANTTPTALMTTTDYFELAPKFMGTIGKLRVWSDDLTDTGIAEATT
jgi:hypothetical protein